MHPAPDELALVALGDGDSGSRDHVQTCPVCLSEVDSLSVVSGILADGGPVPVRAPDHVWTAIAAAINEPESGASSPAPKATETQAVHSARDNGASVTRIDSPIRHSTPERFTRRRFSGVALLGAAAAGAAIVGLGSLASSSDGQQGGQLVASAQLAALEDSVEPGVAEIVERDGHRVLQLETASLPTIDDGYLEVWLLGDDAPGMVTVGTLSNGATEFVLPDGLSTDTYPIIDVSVEHYDGDPAHSGESLWRGPLAST